MSRRRRSVSLDAAARSAARQFDAAARERSGARKTDGEKKQDEPAPPAQPPRQTSARERKHQERLARRAARRGEGGVDDAEYRRTRSEYTKFKYLSTEQVEAIHYELARKFADSDDPIGSDGPVDGGQLLRSAVTRPHTGMRLEGHGQAKYAKVEKAAAALTHSLIHNHPFPDGNKRTATLSLIAFLYENKRQLVAKPDDLYDAIVALARHRVPRTSEPTNNDFASGPDEEVDVFASWVKTHTTDIDRPVRRMQWRKLRTLLVRRGCRVVHGQGNSISVERPGKGKSFIGARNDGDELDASTVRQVMHDLDLASLHTPLAKQRKGAPTFYEEAIDDWREVLYKLGELDRGIVRSPD